MSNSPLMVSMLDAASLSQCWLVGGASAVNWPTAGGILVPSADVILGAATTPQGTLTYSVTWPSGVSAGFALQFQCFVKDPTAPQAFAISNAVRGIVP